MNCISLVGTVHEDAGSANASALNEILVCIQPEVIFLEIPPAVLESELSNRKSLESNAVRQYLQSHQAKLVAVDLPTPERDFFESHERLHMTVRETSLEYRQMLTTHSIRVRTYGLIYLNSKYCSKLWSDFEQEMLSTINRIGDPGLVEIHETWKERNEFREREWIANMQKYCSENVMNKGVILVGSAHRQPIIEKFTEQHEVGPCSFQWDFDAWTRQMNWVMGE
jgi:hypothetical protein